MAARKNQEISRKTSETLILSEAVHRQRMEWLEAAQKSTDLTIRQKALEFSSEVQVQIKTPQKYLSAPAAASLVLPVIILGVFAIWYVVTQSPPEAVIMLVSAITGGVLLALGVILLLSGHIFKEEFMQLVSWAREHFPKWGEPKDPQE